jgi:tRNA threonylcarbamoyladenosine biosynthesis protein TsaE
LRWPSPSPEATRAAARALAGCIGPEGVVIALVGPLGAGKTAFVKGLAEGLGIDPARVASPTFTIASEYPLPDGTRLAHVDVYRLASPAELEAAGFLDLLADARVVAVEWADRLPGALPAEHLEIRIERPNDAGGDAAGAARVLHATATGEGPRAVLARWRAALDRMPRWP